MVQNSVPSVSSRENSDDPHGVNPTVRARRGIPEHVAWAYVRANGGRGFGFTGGHWHWSWASDSFRTLVLNGIAWTAGLEIPAQGVPSKTPSFAEREENPDYPQPADFDRQHWEAEIAK